MSKWKLFLLLSLLSTVGVLIFWYANRPKERRFPALVPVGDRVYITSQLSLAQAPRLRWRGIRTLVDIRPDGEAADQPSSKEIGDVATQAGLSFHYVPVPHENIPPGAVDGLEEALASPEALPAVLYCRTGRRAARLFALAEASRVDGPAQDAIMEMVRKAGFSADDLQEEISRRIAQRTSAKEASIR
jgi:uncharacterized protein (TIGR01244 family)